MPYLELVTVAATDYVRGRTVKAEVAARWDNVPYRIGKRTTLAHKLGLRYVRALPRSVSSDMPYIAVRDNEGRILAAWRAMDSLPGYTGTGGKHPLVGTRSMFYRR